MLFQELGKMKRSWIMTSIIMIAIGIEMILCPVRYLGLLIAALGYVLLVMATVMVLDFLSSKKVLINYIYLTGGLFIGLLGLFVLTARKDVLPLLSLLFGLGLIVEGFNSLFNSFIYARKAGRGAWWILAILSVLTIVFGGILLFNAFRVSASLSSLVVLKQVIGSMLLFSSLVNIIRVILTWPFRTV